MPIPEQRRFLRHARALWDVHRHRVAPEIADLLADMRAEGQVLLHVGVLISYFNHGDSAKVRYWDQESRLEKTLRVARVINCTGSETDCRRIDDSLITSLFVQGLARPDALFLGLDVDENGRLVDYKGTASRHLYAIGPPRKGSLWETTTVYEIRQQAVDLAQSLVEQLENASGRSRSLKTAV